MRQSAGNPLGLNPLGIFRDYTPSFICCKVSSDSIKKNKRYVLNDNFQIPKNFSTEFSSYLAGLIEGDGTIIVPKSERSPKGKINYPSVQIVFNLKDLPLALMIQKELGHGSLARKKGVNAYILTINNYEGIILIATLLNGKMRTPKMFQLYLLIDWLNNRFDELKIVKAPKDISAINGNAWLSGFIEADGYFFANVSSKSISCGFELVQSSINKQGLSKKEIMVLLANYLNVKLREYGRKKYPNYLEYGVRTGSLNSNLILIDYFCLGYPLFSSKYLNYMDWLTIIEIIKKGEHKTKQGQKEIILIKDKMNSKRTVFTWNHLQNFYNLYK